MAHYKFKIGPNPKEKFSAKISAALIFTDSDWPNNFFNQSEHSKRV